MKSRSTPAAATWFLMQFGSGLEDEFVIGDLVEQYQRDRGGVWYWRQVLSIIFMGLYREVRRDKRGFSGELFRTWCRWGGLNVFAAVLVMMRYVSLHPRSWDRSYGMSGTGFPLMTLRVGQGYAHQMQWAITPLCVILNVLTLLVVGRMIAVSTRIHPRTLLLAFVTSYVAATAALTISHFLQIYFHQTNDLTYLTIDLIALPLVPALLLIGAGSRKSKEPNSIATQ